MKQCLMMFMLLVIGVCSHAQENIDSVAFRFVYDVQAKKFERSKTLSPDEHWLDVGKGGASKYYSKWKERGFHLQDSIGRIGGSEEDASKVRFDMSTDQSTFPYYVYKNYPTAGRQTVNYISWEYVQYEEPMGQEWELVEGDTIILEHPCQKAVCHYHGKTWTAFYATDIPISEGPWKLCGLPGLIMRAYDSDGLFIFNCIGILQNLDEQIVMRNKRFRKLKPEQAHKLAEQMDSDPEGVFVAKGYKGKAKIVDQYGRERVMNITIPKPAYYEYYTTDNK